MLKGIYVTPQMVSSIRDGRASIKPTGEEDIYIPCDVLIVAIGQNIETHHFEQAGIPVERGKIDYQKHRSIREPSRCICRRRLCKRTGFSY